MAGVAGRSGGHNKLTIEEHLVRGTFRPGRHLAALPAAPEPGRLPNLDASERRRGAAHRGRGVAPGRSRPRRAGARGVGARVERTVLRKGVGVDGAEPEITKA